MSNLISCQNITKSFGAQTLFKNISFSINNGEKVGIIGPNGSGKSTLLKIICQLEEADDGAILKKKIVRMSYLAQEDVFDEEENISDNLFKQLKDHDLQESEKYSRVHAILSRAEFVDHSVAVSLLSGGWRKRLAICSALVSYPDVLVMDEPTNHLDIEGILWLEKLMAGSFSEGPKAILLVSHDRQFLENCTNRIIELSAVYPDGALQVVGNYSKFLEEREHLLQLQSEQQIRLSNKVRRETEWLQRGPKARTTKAKYRIDAAHKLIGELGEVKSRNNAISSVRIGFDSTGRKTKKLVEAVGLTKSFGEQQLFRDLDIILSPGFRLGLLGRNGCGKSTLMNFLAEAIEEGGKNSDNGVIKVADKVKVANFDQRREQLDTTQTLKKALAPDGDSITYQDRSIHVVSWAKRFLFRPDQLETPVDKLSGGEQARILIARLMRQTADVLLLDEPTNDLDIDSLDVLEESLLEFPGALVLVSHDRYMLDRICDLVIGFDGKGEAAYFADYTQWLADLEQKENVIGKKEQKDKVQILTKKKKTGKLSYMDQRDYDTIEERIEELEQKQEALQRTLESEEVAADPEKLDEYWKKLQLVQEETESLYSRWDELEAKLEEMKG